MRSLNDLSCDALFYEINLNFNTTEDSISFVDNTVKSIKFAKLTVGSYQSLDFITNIVLSKALSVNASVKVHYGRFFIHHSYKRIYKNQD